MGFFFEELLFPSHFQISEKSLFLLHIELFNISSLSFLCFISSLSSDSINLTLSICSFFLQISELLNFSFFLLFDSFFFHLMFKFSLLFFLDISHDCVIFLFFLNFLLLFHCLIKSVSCLNIYEHLSSSILLCSCCFFFFKSHCFNLSSHLLSLPFSYFAFFDSLLISLLNLVNNYLFAHEPGFLAFLFSFFFSDNTLHSFNFHQKI